MSVTTSALAQFFSVGPDTGATASRSSNTEHGAERLETQRFDAVAHISTLPRVPATAPCLSAVYDHGAENRSGGFVKQTAAYNGELRAGATASATSLLVSAFLARLVAIWREATKRRRHGLGEADDEASLGDNVTPSVEVMSVGRPKAAGI